MEHWRELPNVCEIPSDVVSFLGGQIQVSDLGGWALHMETLQIQYWRVQQEDRGEGELCTFPPETPVRSQKLSFLDNAMAHANQQSLRKIPSNGIDTKLFKFLFDWPPLMLFGASLPQASLSGDLKHIHTVSTQFSFLLTFNSEMIFSSLALWSIFPFIENDIQKPTSSWG